MATSSQTDPIEQIGQTAGLVWHKLRETGPLSLAKLVQAIDAPRDVTLQAIGWLAREGKLLIENTGRGRTLALR